MDATFRRRMLMHGGVIMASIILFLIGFVLIKSHMGGEVAGIKEARSTLHRYAVSVDTLASLKREAAEEQTYKDKIAFLLPTKDELLALPKWIDGMARVYPVSLTFSFQGATELPTETGTGHVGFAFETSGTFEQINNFLIAAEMKSPRFMLKFDTIDIVKGSSNYRASVRGRAFYR